MDNLGNIIAVIQGLIPMDQISTFFESLTQNETIGAIITTISTLFGNLG